MSTNSKIEWTDSTWNPVRGCTKVSPVAAREKRAQLLWNSVRNAREPPPTTLLPPSS